MTNDLRRTCYQDQDKKWKQKLKEEKEKFLKNLSEENAELAKLMKLGTQTMGKHLKEYQNVSKIFSEALNFDDLEALVGAEQNKAQRKIRDKYDFLRNEINLDKNLSQAQKDYWNNEYDEKEIAESTKAYKESPMGELGDEMSKNFSAGLQEMIKGYKNFSDVTKDITNSMANYMIKKMSDAVMESIFSQENMKLLTGMLGGLFNWGGVLLGSAGGLISGLFTKHHSGGIAPVGANMQLPGTQEQLALLKGGERILSPAENTSYNSNQGASPVVFNNFNVKAWDSKDVSKYLWENRTLLNQITFQGIKDNDAHLRTMVRNA